MKDIYEAYADISNDIRSGYVRYDELDALEQMVYDLGQGNVSYSDIPTKYRDELSQKVSGTFNFLGSVANRFKEAGSEMQAGIRGIPAVQDLTSWVAGKIAGHPVPESANPFSGADFGDRAWSTLGGLGKLLMGTAGLFPSGPIGGAAGESAWRATGGMGGQWGRTIAELGGQLAASPLDAGIMRILGGQPAVRKALQLENELVPARSTAIEVLPAQGPKRLEDLGGAQGDLFAPRVAPGGVQRTGPQVLDTGERQAAQWIDSPRTDLPVQESFSGLQTGVAPASPGVVVRGPVQLHGTQGTGEMVAKTIYTAEQKEKIDALNKFLRKRNLSEADREWAQQQLVNLDNEAKVALREKRGLVRSQQIAPHGPTAEHGIFDMPATQGEFNLADDVLTAGGKGATKDITIPIMAEAEGILASGPSALSRDIPFQQTLDLGQTLGPTKAHVRSLGDEVAWVESGNKRVASGQLDSVGFQQELFDELPKVQKLTPEAYQTQRLEKDIDTYKQLMEAATDPSAAIRQIERITKSNPEAAADPGLFTKLQNAMIKSTGLLVTAPQTGIRNFLQQMVRGGVEVPLQAYQEILQTGSLRGAWDRASTQVGALFDYRKVAGDLEDAVKRLPAADREMLARRGISKEYEAMATPDWYDKTVGKAQNTLNMLNEAQERAFWHANFLASINGDLTSLGLKLGRDVKAGQLPQEVIEKAAKHANEMTYSRPMSKAMSEAFAKLYEVPVIGLLVNEAAPFARFNYGNALRDVIDFSPAGFAKAAMTKNPEEAARIMAKSMLGTKVIEQVARLKEDGKDGVWEITVPGLGRIDTRKWHPMDAYAFLGELINRPPGSPNTRISPGDFLSLFSGGTRFDDTAMGLLARLQDFTQEGATEGLMQTLSQFVGRWTTPMKWGQDAYALASGDPNVMADRDVMGRKFGVLDRAMTNIPGLRQLLPERIDPSLEETPGPKSRFEYLQRMTGLEPVKSNYIKDELKRLSFKGPQGNVMLDQLYDQLGVAQEDRGEMRSSTSAGDFERKMYASTGNKELNRTLNGLMRDYGSKALDMVMQSPAYQNAPDATRRVLVDMIQSDVKKALTQAAKSAAGPEAAIEMFFKNLSPTVRGLLDYAAR